MPVSLYKPGDEAEEGHIAVQGHFEPLDCVRVNLVSMDNQEDVLASYIVMRGVGDPDDVGARALMDLSGATTANLWYSITENGLMFIRDVDTIVDLEQCLTHYEDFRKATMQ